MAHFAQLNANNDVMEVIVVSNDEILDENGNESEEKGIAFCKNLFGEDTVWVQTSYNSSFRKNYGTVGMSYDPNRDAFLYQKPPHLNSWVLDEETCLWVAPVPMPTDGKNYEWDEDSISWVEYKPDHPLPSNQ
jgi:hypothetical protein